MMMTGVIRGRNASFVLSTTSRRSALLLLRQIDIVLLDSAMATMMATAINTPGMKPARKSLPIDTPVSAP